jgi:hypothetical protein
MRLLHPSIDPRYNYAISQVFGASLVKRITDEEHEQGIRSLLQHSGLYSVDENWDFVEGLSRAYQYLKRYHRCEYVYKNEIVNQILLTFHKDNSATLLKEVASDSSIADIVIINGRTVAYEIKTELDNFDRLSGQLDSYESMYDCLYIVTHSGAIENISKRVKESVGLIVLSENGKLRTVRKAASTAHLFAPAKAVLTLRQAELVTAYEKWVGKMPKMGTALIYTFCHNWYLNLDREDAHVVFAEALKSRRPTAHQYELITSCDASLRMLFVGRELSKKYCTIAKEKLGIFA